MRLRWKAGLTAAAVLTAVTATAPAAQAATTANEWGAVRNFETKLCLQEIPGGDVRTRICNGTNDQTWQWSGPGYEGRLKNRSTGRCLDGSGDQIYTSANCTTPSTYWTYHGGGYILQLESGRALDSNYAGDVYLHVHNWGNYQSWF